MSTTVFEPSEDDKELIEQYLKDREGEKISTESVSQELSAQGMRPNTNSLDKMFYDLYKENVVDGEDIVLPNFTMEYKVLEGISDRDIASMIDDEYQNNRLGISKKEEMVQ